MKKVLKIDENGYLKFGEDLFIESGIVPEGYIDISLPIDVSGNQLPFYKPKWDGLKWVEGLPQDELDEIEYQQYLNSLKPSDEEIKKAQMELLMLELLIDMEVM